MLICIRNAELSLKIIRYSAVIIMHRHAGHDILRALRRWRKNGMDMPVLVINDPADVSARVDILNAGADDWLAAPAASAEVIARLYAILRRGTGSYSAVLKAGAVSFDTCNRSVTLRGENIKLTARESTIMELLIQRYPRILTRRCLEDNLCSWEREVSSNTLEVHISNLRRKLGRGIIETVHGTSYRLLPPD